MCRMSTWCFCCRMKLTIFFQQLFTQKLTTADRGAKIDFTTVSVNKASCHVIESQKEHLSTFSFCPKKVVATSFVEIFSDYPGDFEDSRPFLGPKYITATSLGNPNPNITGFSKSRWFVKVSPRLREDDQMWERQRKCQP